MYENREGERKREREEGTKYVLDYLYPYIFDNRAAVS